MRSKYVRNYLKISLKRRNSESENVLLPFLNTENTEHGEIPWSVPDHLVSEKLVEVT